GRGIHVELMAGTGYAVLAPMVLDDWIAHGYSLNVLVQGTRGNPVHESAEKWKRDSIRFVTAGGASGVSTDRWSGYRHGTTKVTHQCGEQPEHGAKHQSERNDHGLLGLDWSVWLYRTLINRNQIKRIGIQLHGA